MSEDPSRRRGGSPPEQLLGLIRGRTAATRSVLVEETGWARTVLTQRLGELIDLGLVVEDGVGASTGGRAPRELRFRREAAAVVGIEVGATGVHVAVTDLAGGQLAARGEPWDVAEGPERTLRKLEAVVRQVVGESPVSHEDVVGIGVGLPGPVEFGSGLPVSPPIMPGWNLFPVRDWLAQRFGVHVVVDNDVNTMALAEQRTGLARGIDDFIFVKIGTGIGAGIVSNGSLHRGADGGAGDIGHIAVDTPSDVLCRCGRYGCLEAYAGGAALARQARQAAEDGSSRHLAAVVTRSGRPPTSTDVNAGATAGDPVCLALLDAAARQIGKAMSGAVNFFNPRLIVFGGGVTGAGDYLLPGIRRGILELSLPLSTRRLQIEITRLGERAGSTGAALSVVDELMRADRLPWWAERAARGAETRPPGRRRPA